MIVYKIFNKINWKVYIGITTCKLSKRFNEHKCEANKESPSLPLHRAIKKYGVDNFIVAQIDCANTREELQEKEIYWISYYESNNNEFGYNLRGGGELPYHSDESIKKQKMSTRMRPPSDGRCFKGIAVKKNGCTSYIFPDNKRVHLGTYDSEYEAAWAREINCKKYFGEGNYYSNFPNGMTDELRDVVRKNKEKYLNKAFGVYYCTSINKWRTTVPSLNNPSRTKLIKQSGDKIVCMCAYDAYVIKHNLDLPLNFNYGPNSYFQIK